MSALPTVESTVQLCAFVLGRTEYVVDLMRVEEILPALVPTPVPRAPDFVAGVIHLRGGIVPVVDARLRLAAGPPRPGLKPKLVVCLLGRNRVALQVDGVTEVVRVSRNDLKPAPSLGEASGQPYVVGACGTPERLRLLLNLKALLQPEE